MNVYIWWQKLAPSPSFSNSILACFERSCYFLILMTFDLFWPVTLNDHQCQSISEAMDGDSAAAQKNLNENFLLTGSFIFLVTVLSFGHGMDADMMQKPECQMWAKLENKTLPLQDQGHANCTTNSDCTGFSCKGIYQVRKSLIGINLFWTIKQKGLALHMTCVLSWYWFLPNPEI